MAPTNGITYSEAFAEFEDEDLDTFELENFETFSPEKKKKGGFLTVFTSLKSIFVSKKRDKGHDRRKAISMPEFAISQQVENKNFLANPVNRRVTVPDNIYHSYSTYEALLEDEKEQFEVRLVTVSESKSSELDYDYKRKIGVGSFGAVYLVENRYTREINAIKEIDYTSSTMKRLAEKERDHLFACSSPFIVSLVDFYYKEDSQICLVMEYLGDANLLRHLVRYGKLSETLTKFYTAQIILAIEYMHNVNLIHRDLKPENIMITRDGYIKVGQDKKKSYV
ncbi:unnamed protein product [Orchesella dallaii]|uniref:non-specific serine/threonine protein kinase n=1 Tax=Orchesella dallaii TaxID=48710 RepID=A0ABP1S701_9HEXA